MDLKLLNGAFGVSERPLRTGRSTGFTSVRVLTRTQRSIDMVFPVSYSNLAINSYAAIVFPASRNGDFFVSSWASSIGGRYANSSNPYGSVSNLFSYF